MKIHKQTWFKFFNIHILSVLFLLCAIRSASCAGDLLSGSWAYDAGVSFRQSGHAGMTTDGDSSTCLITTVYTDPWVRLEIGNKDGRTHNEFYVINRVEMSKCQGQNCAVNKPSIYVTQTKDHTKVTEGERCGSYDSRSTVNVTCNQLQGSDIIIKVQGSTSLGVCDVAAYGYKLQVCSNGNYGPNCNTPCRCQEQCDSVSGVCSVSCVAGWRKNGGGVCNIRDCNNDYYGPNCNIPCNCQQQCDSGSGVCSVSCVAGWRKDGRGVCNIRDCSNGYYGPNCNTPCNCQQQCDSVSGVCSVSCVAGWRKDGRNVCNIRVCSNGNYGSACHIPCHCGQQCDTVSGACPVSCVNGKMKDNAGVCSVPCNNGRYGVDCSMPCHCQSQCDAVIGRCSTSCDAGWRKDSSDVCSIRVCSNGNYGASCQIPCHCSQQCDSTTGACPVSCAAGKGKDNTGVCNIDCSNGQYGVNCSVPCHCELQCDAVTGVCSASCAAGKLKNTAGVCDVDCSNKTYGMNCSQLCHCTEQCDRVTGACSASCDRGWKKNNNDVCVKAVTVPPKGTGKPPGTTDKQGAAPMSQDLMIGIIVIVIVIVFVLIVFIVVVTMRLRKRKKAAIQREKRISRAYEMDAAIMNGGYDDIDDSVFESPRSSSGVPVAVVLPVAAPSADQPENQFEEDEEEEEEEENVLPAEPIYGNVNDTNVSHSITLPDLAAYIHTKEQEETPFKTEFQHIPYGLMAVCEVGQRPINKSKNRFVNIWPYDHTRVILSKIEGDADSDYINACYIDGYKKQKTYVASQAPKKCTLNDMWRMIWETNCRRIAMVTRSLEGGRVKCEQYWPDSGSCVFGDITVTLVGVKELADYTVRSMNVVKAGCEERSVVQLCFTSWPDHNVPSSTAPILSFRSKVRSYEASHPGPTLVHCSAGVGRTGAYIALDYLLEQGAAEGEVDVYSFVQLMRTQRVNMIQTVLQYHFVYRCLRDAFISGDTCYTASSFKDQYTKLQTVDTEANKSYLQLQFEAVQSLLPNVSNMDFSFALGRENHGKNRRDDVLPENFNRPFLMTPAKGRNNYINAVFANSYQRKDGFIVTQMPLPDTGVDFWRMIYDQNVYTIVMLNTIDEADKNSGRYWPLDRQTRTFEPFKVTLAKIEHPLEDISVRTMKLMNSVKANDDIRTIKQFQLTSWPESADVPQDKVSLQLLLEQVDAWRNVTSGPLVVHDLYGLSKCGIFCTVSSVRERIKADQEVDILTAVRQVCQGRPQLITSLEQYQFCYEMVARFLSQFDVYENFQPMTNL